MPSPIVPQWFKQRQLKGEPAGADTVRVTGPNLGEAFVQVRKADGGWVPAVKEKADGLDIASADALPNETDGWAAAFELYRRRFIN